MFGDFSRGPGVRGRKDEKRNGRRDYLVVFEPKSEDRKKRPDFERCGTVVFQILWVDQLIEYKSSQTRIKICSKGKKHQLEVPRPIQKEQLPRKLT